MVYEKARAERIEFDSEDVITTSGMDGENSGGCTRPGYCWTEGYQAGGCVGPSEICHDLLTRGIPLSNNT